jgi:hypothetical protein
VSTADPTPPEPAPDDARSRRWALLRRLALSAFSGGMASLSLTTESRGFWDGLLIGVAAQILIRGVIRLCCGGRQGSWLGVVLSVAAGAGLGAGLGYFIAPDHVVSLAIVGGLVGVVDSVISWVLGATANPRRDEAADADVDADLRNGADENDIESL